MRSVPNLNLNLERFCLHSKFQITTVDPVRQKSNLHVLTHFKEFAPENQAEMHLSQHKQRRKLMRPL